MISHSQRFIKAYATLASLTAIVACGGDRSDSSDGTSLPPTEPPSVVALALGSAPSPGPAPGPALAPGAAPALGVVGKAGVDGQVCTKPAKITPFGTATRTVGDGTPGSCTEAALRTAVAAGGKIAFACGALEKTITLTRVIGVAADADLDGGGRVVLSGGKTTRLFTVFGGKVLTLRNITIRDGYFNNATMKDPDLHWKGAAGVQTNFRGGIIAENVKFLNNVSVQGGVGSERNGGAVSTHESPVAVFYNCLFQGNSGHLGSAINNLLTNLEVVNSSVLDNKLFDEGFGGAIYSDGGARTYDNPNARFTATVGRALTTTLIHRTPALTLTMAPLTSVARCSLATLAATPAAPCTPAVIPMAKPPSIAVSSRTITLATMSRGLPRAAALPQAAMVESW